ncbi:DMT family transporter [Saccharopolyspora taberi]|uniref:SMR family transporter n=1 Tax=Saccharopolyspora taberi TaxID=60895 RepID=A0ABN3VL20_9PSEU
MKKWFLLAGAVCSEVTGSLSLKAATGHPGWYALVVLGYAASFVFLAAVLRNGMALGVAYGVWGALGVGLTAALAAVFFGEALTTTVIAGIGFIVVGVLLIELGSHRAVREEVAA